MESIERNNNLKFKEYRRNGFGHSFCFVDVYVNSRLKDSIMIPRFLYGEEIERFANVYISKAKGENDKVFLDSTENKINSFFKRNEYYKHEMEKVICSKMGKEKFEKHYETKCYYLMCTPLGEDKEWQETFHISESYPPLNCLKMAKHLADIWGGSYRILLSDHETEVDKELLEFALCEE